MGAHGVGLFDDDDGADFAADILQSRTIDIIIDTLAVIPTEDWEYVEDRECVRALLAAELIAEQMGRESGDLPDDLHSWIQEFGDARDDHVSMARSAVERIVRSSELRDSWSDSKHFEKWHLKYQALANRLRW